MQTIGWAVGTAVGMFGIALPAYLNFHWKKKQAAAMTAKGLCTLLAVLLCGAGALRAGTPDARWMTAGLFVCMIADVVIERKFLGGVAVFAAGHLCYLAAFGRMAPFSGTSIVIFAAAALLILLFARRLLGGSDGTRVPLLCYAAVITAMLSVAVMLPRSIGARGWVTAAGAVLFTLSDLLLARNLFLRGTRLSETVSLSCYYAGQYLLALSVALFV